MTTTSHHDTLTVQDRLLNAAEQVVGRDGVASLTLDAVAREAGFSKGGLLYHFPSKQALVTAIVERLATRCEANHAQALDDQGTGPGAFTRAYLAARTRQRDPQEEPLHTALLAAAGTDPQFLEPFRTRLRGWQAQLENDGIDPVIATIVRMAIDGICLDELLDMPGPNEQLRQRVIERLFEMARPHKNQE